MEIIYLLVIIMPGLYIYNRLKVGGHEINNNDTEYVVLVRGLFYSLPFWGFLILYSRLKYPTIELLTALKTMMLDYKYIFAYFVAIILYTYLVIKVLYIYRLNVRPEFLRVWAKISKKKSYVCGYSNAWEEVFEKYMKSYDCVVGRLLYDGKVVDLGLIDFLCTSIDRKQREVGFTFRKEYEAYFPNGEPLLENLCSYVDLSTGYVLELYNGKNQINGTDEILAK